MNRIKIVISGLALGVAGLALAALPVSAQASFQSYRCSDGTQFIVGFYQYDTRAYVQLDGGSVTLARKFTLSGARYSGHGVTLKITPAGTTLKHAKRPVTACEMV